MPTPGRKLTLLAATACICMMLVAAIALRVQIREGYLLWRLQHGDPSQRAEAAKDLAEMGSISAVPHLLGEYGARCQFQVRLPAGSIYEGYSRGHADGAEELRGYIQAILTRVREHEVRLVLRRALREGPSDVRAGVACAVMELAMNVGDLSDELASASGEDPEWHVRALALLAIAEIARSKGGRADALDAALQDSEERVRIVASKELQGLKSSASLSALSSSLKDKSASVRLNCAIGLGLLGANAQSAIPALQEVAAMDPESVVREVAVDALKEIESTHALPRP